MINLLGAGAITRKSALDAAGNLDSMAGPLLTKRRTVDLCRVGSCLCPAF